MKTLHRIRSLGRWVPALLLILVASLVLAACGSNASEVESEQQPQTETEQPGGGGFQAMVMTTPLEKPDFTLPDTSGVPFDFRKETEGYVTILYFGYTHCPDICPAQMARLAAGIQALPEDVSSQIKVVFVTCDPDRDTPERVREWLDAFDPKFIGLITESQQQTDEISQVALKSFWAPLTNTETGGGDYVVAHPAVLICYSPDNLAHLFYPFGIKKEVWEHDLGKLVREGWTE